MSEALTAVPLRTTTVMTSPLSLQQTGTGKGGGTVILSFFGHHWPFVAQGTAVVGGTGLWVYATALQNQAATVFAILTLAAAQLISIYQAVRRARRAEDIADREAARTDQAIAVENLKTKVLEKDAAIDQLSREKAGLDRECHGLIRLAEMRDHEIARLEVRLHELTGHEAITPEATEPPP